MCLWQVQEWWATGHAYPDALSQWAAAQQHHDASPPVGAPVFYSGGSGGHVAVYLGAGMIRSTDAPTLTLVGTVPLSWPTRRWGHPYAGWSSDLAGITLPLSAPAPVTGRPVYLSRLHYGQTSSDSVADLQARLNAVYLDSGHRLPVTGNYLTLTDAAVRGWQGSIGNRVDAPLGSSVGPLQAARLWSGTGVTILP